MAMLNFLSFLSCVRLDLAQLRDVSAASLSTGPCLQTITTLHGYSTACARRFPWSRLWLLLLPRVRVPKCVIALSFSQFLEHCFVYGHKGTLYSRGRSPDFSFPPVPLSFPLLVFACLWVFRFLAHCFIALLSFFSYLLIHTFFIF